MVVTRPSSDQFSYQGRAPYSKQCSSFLIAHVLWCSYGVPVRAAATKSSCSTSGVVRGHKVYNGHPQDLLAKILSYGNRTTTLML